MTTAQKPPSARFAVIIDARAAAYAGDPMRIMGVCNSVSGKLLIQKMADWNEPVTVKDDTTVVTDTPNHFRHWSLAFDEKDHLRQVIKAFSEATRSKSLIIAEELRRFDPGEVIQMRKFDERGAALEFDSFVLNNGHMAILLAVWAARKAHGGYIINYSHEDISADDQDDNALDDDMLPFSI